MLYREPAALSRTRLGVRGVLGGHAAGEVRAKCGNNAMAWSPTVLKKFLGPQFCQDTFFEAGPLRKPTLHLCVRPALPVKWNRILRI